MLFAACAHVEVQHKYLPSSVVSHKREVLSPKLLEAILGEREGDAYRVGPGDTVLVAIYGHPELSLAQYTGFGGGGGKGGGLLVDNDGTIQLPLIGSVRVVGKTVEQMRAFLEQELANHLKEPKVTVQVAFNGSIRYYLLGQFADPGVKYSDRPLRLREALALGGTVMLEKASLHGAYVARGDTKLPVDFDRLLRRGDPTQNIRLRSGDTVFVPDDSHEIAFVFTGVTAGNTNIQRGGVVQFHNGSLDILQALAAQGYGFRERTQGRLSKTRVIRSEGDRAELFVVNVSAILAGEAAPFALQPGDVVYVPPSATARWNQVLEQLVPTLQAVGGVLAPWVQIRYLQNSD
jgi:polysaccharide export outer membrane protein